MMADTRKEERTWFVISMAAVALMALLTAYQLFVPPQTIGQVTNRNHREEVKLEAQTKALRTSVTENRTFSEGKIWAATSQTIGPSMMSVVDAAAQSQNLTLQSFRPQRVVVSNKLVRYPYLAVVQGHFPQLIAFIHRLEQPETKLGVFSVQVSSADGASDLVTASVGVCAFTSSDEDQQNGKK